MNMKIGQTGAAPAVNTVAGNGNGQETAHAQRQKASGGTTVSGGGSAQVQLSSTAKALLEGADSGFDQAKVDRVKASIANGTYKINPEAIADKLIANAQEVLGKVAPR